MEDLIQYAMRRGWGVKFRDLGRRNGQYSQGLIVINDRRGRTMFKQRMVLAHEIGHAHHNHAWTDDTALFAKQEHEADIFAAHLLITPADYAYAEELAGHHPGAIAKELCVSEHYVTLWRETYRTGRRGHLWAV